MKKVSVIFGTRPEAIKLAPLIIELQKHKDIKVEVCLTGQHHEMVWQVLDFFDIKPDHEFRLMTKNQTLASFTSKALQAIDEYLEINNPDLVLVQGDTSTVMATSMACYFRGVPLGHVEAGLRSGSFQHPFPEEYNRVVTSLTTRLHFAPTLQAEENLLKAGADKSHVFVTGNTVIDALLSAVEKNKQKQPEFETLNTLPEKLILVTGHRRENFGDGLKSICEAFLEILEKFPDHEIIYPVHLNPNVKGPVHELLGNQKRIHLMEPVDYAQMVFLMEHAQLIISDSGGIQEEAPALGKPVLVTRETTERPEGVEAGTAKLVGTDKKKIVEETIRLLTDEQAYQSMAKAHNPYGDGTASQKIAQAIIKYFSN